MTAIVVSTDSITAYCFSTSFFGKVFEMNYTNSLPMMYSTFIHISPLCVVVLSISALLPAFSAGPLTWVWTQYATTLALGDLPTDLLVNYHRHFATMPWHQFYPDLADLDHMIQVGDTIVAESNGCQQSAASYYK